MKDGTMTAGELVTVLSDFPADWRVFVGEGVAITGIEVETDDEPLLDMRTEVLSGLAT